MEKKPVPARRRGLGGVAVVHKPVLLLPQAPEKYRRMLECIKNSPPQILEHKDALDMYVMAVTFLGGPPWSDEHLGKILAWAQLAGFPECCALSKALNTVIIVASYRFCMRGGHLPDIELMEQVFYPRQRELFEQGKDTPWLPELMERYKIENWKTLNYKAWYDPHEGGGK